MKNVLIINPFGIGDVLFTTPVIKALKERDKNIRITYWSNLRVKDILKSNPGIDRIIALSRGDLKRIYEESVWQGIINSLKLVSSLLKERIDTCFDFSLDHRYSLLCKLIGIKQRIGFDYKRRGRFLTQRIVINGYQHRPVVEYYLDLLRFAGVQPKDPSLELSIPADADDYAKRLLHSRGIKDGVKIVVIAPGAGASWGKEAHLKHWPAVKFAQLADKITDESGAQVVIVGDDQERPIADIILATVKNKVIDLVGKTSLTELAAVLKNSSLVVTNDGGPLHIAVALGVNTVSMFGPVDECVYGPYPVSGRHIVIRKDLACRPCYHNFRMPLCEKEKECIKSITVDEVFAAVRRLL